MSLPAVEVSQSPEDKFREYLNSRSRPQRFTEQQRDLVQLIFQRHSHFDADKLIEELKEADLSVSRATVYRTLRKLVDAGLLRSIELGARTYYEHDYGYPQHEHLFCDQCNTMIEFQASAIESVVQEVSSRHHFRPSGHSLIIRGVCGECNRGRSSKRLLDLI